MYIVTIQNNIYSKKRYSSMGILPLVEKVIESIPVGRFEFSITSQDLVLSLDIMTIPRFSVKFKNIRRENHYHLVALIMRKMEDESQDISDTESLTDIENLY